MSAPKLFEIVFVHYDFAGVLEPINQDASSIFEKGTGRIVPVKFQLKDANNNFISTARASISLKKLEDTATDTKVETPSTGTASTGNSFAYDSGANAYIYNLVLDKLSAGTWRFNFELDDGTMKYVDISVR
ncbi:MAG TPA: PxKF domain-containing protein [Candidatus Aquicultor sp.]|jgi:hypothetical protein